MEYIHSKSTKRRCKKTQLFSPLRSDPPPPQSTKGGKYKMKIKSVLRLGMTIQKNDFNNKGFSGLNIFYIF